MKEQHKTVKFLNEKAWMIQQKRLKPWYWTEQTIARETFNIRQKLFVLQYSNTDKAEIIWVLHDKISLPTNVLSMEQEIVSKGFLERFVPDYAKRWSIFDDAEEI